MQAGRLRHRVEIQSPVEVQGDTGEMEVPVFKALATVWASIEPIAGREFYAAAQVQAEADTRIRIRYLEGITEKMRVVHRDSVYDIESVQNIQTRDRELHLMCVKREAEGFRSNGSGT